jgi:hypothetical protein
VLHILVYEFSTATTLMGDLASALAFALALDGV